MSIRDDEGPRRTLRPMDIEHDTGAEAPPEEKDEDVDLLRSLLPEDPSERRKAMGALLRKILSTTEVT